MKRSVRVLLVLFVGLAAGAVPGVIRGQEVGAIPVYVYPTLRVWRVHLDSEPGAILDALESIAKESKLTLVRVPGEESTYRLERKRLDHKELEEYCHYPIRDLSTWEPVKTFQKEYRHAVTTNRRREWDGRVRLDLYMPADRDRALVATSSCYVFLFHRGRGVLATSRAVYERTPLESLAAALKPDASVTVEPLPQIEPDLAGIRGKETRIVTTCGFTGVYVDSRTGEVTCTPPEGTHLVSRTGTPTAGEKRSASSFSIREEGAGEPGRSPVISERAEMSLTVEVLHDEKELDSQQDRLLLRLTACGVDVEEASVITVNDHQIPPITVTFTSREEGDGCTSINATMDLKSIDRYFSKGSNRFTVDANGTTAEAVLEIQR